MLVLILTEFIKESSEIITSKLKDTRIFVFLNRLSFFNNFISMNDMQNTAIKVLASPGAIAMANGTTTIDQ
jgi:ABC-type Zn2+ transport system substrate-binding protein/surface adhesin